MHSLNLNFRKYVYINMQVLYIDIFFIFVFFILYEKIFMENIIYS